MKLVERGGNKFYIADKPPDRLYSWFNLWLEDAYKNEEPGEQYFREMRESLALVKGFLKAPFASPGTRLVELLLLKWRQINLENNVEELRYSEDFGLLTAHGLRRHEWSFRDGEDKVPVQQWVDQVDGKCRAFFILCCNPYNREIKSGASVIVHPRGIVSRARVNLGLVNLRVYHPQKGYLN